MKQTNMDKPGSGGASLPMRERGLKPDRLWDLVLTGKEFKEGRKEVLEIEKMFKKWKVVKK